MLHFVLLGAGLFGLYRLTSDENTTATGEQIVVTAGKLEHLATLFGRTWQRPPTRQELQGLVDDYVREEVAYREGVALGLDRNDTIIRRRIRQKLDFVADEFASQLEPTEEELADYLQKHAEDFQIPSRMTFQHVYFNPDRHDGDASEMVTKLVAEVQANPAMDPLPRGDRTLLDSRFEDVSKRDVNNMFGSVFADAVFGLEPEAWHGPVESSFGFHMVRIEALEPGRVPDLETARRSVRREWEHARRVELEEKFYEQLLEKYEVVVEWPEPESA